jgi:hypothetical protein
MNCEQVQERLWEHLKGRLGDEEAAGVADHLAGGCASCLDAVARLRGTLDTIRAEPRIEPREETWLRLREQTAGSIQMRGGRPGIGQILRLLAAFIIPLLILLLVYWLRQHV